MEIEIGRPGQRSLSTRVNEYVTTVAQLMRQMPPGAVLDRIGESTYRVVRAVQSSDSEALTRWYCLILATCQIDPRVDRAAALLGEIVELVGKFGFRRTAEAAVSKTEGGYMVGNGPKREVKIRLEQWLYDYVVDNANAKKTTFSAEIRECVRRCWAYDQKLASEEEQ